MLDHCAFCFPNHVFNKSILLYFGFAYSTEFWFWGVRGLWDTDWCPHRWGEIDEGGHGQAAFG